MCKPIIQTYLALVFHHMSDDGTMHGVHRHNDEVCVPYLVSGRDHAAAEKLATKEGADEYYFFDVASVAVTVRGKPVVLRSEQLNPGVRTRVFGRADVTV